MLALPSSDDDDDDDFGFSVVIILEGSTVRKYCMILYLCCSLLDTIPGRYSTGSIKKPAKVCFDRCVMHVDVFMFLRTIIVLLFVKDSVLIMP